MTKTLTGRTYKIEHQRDVTYDLLWGPPGPTVLRGPYPRQGYDAYVALSGSQVIGCLIGSITWEGRWHSEGTLILPGWRRQGIAEALWKQMIRDEQVKSVFVSLVSDKGKTLIAALQRKYPKVDWEVVDSGARRLRVLRRGAQIAADAGRVHREPRAMASKC